MVDRRSGSADQRRYAAAARQMQQFIEAPEEIKPRILIISPVRHAARYNRAFRWVDAKEREDIRRLKERLDVTGFVMVLDDQHLVHALRQHGNTAVEAKRGQLPIGRLDYRRLPQIVGDTDTVTPGATGQRGGPRVLVEKHVEDAVYRVILQARARRCQIAFLTMFKSKGRL